MRSKVYRWVLLRSIILIPVVSDTGIVWMDMIRIGGRWTPAIVRLYITVYHRETMCFGWKLPAMVPIGALPLPNLSRIFPPWWRTWWFILLVFVVVCVLLCIAYKSRVRWYQLRQAELECKIQERTRLLKQAKQELEEKMR